jgi:glycosyltransferase involved in cell wall biosynthesis
MFPFKIDVIIPANNEEKSIGRVIDEIPKYIRNIVVINNKSTDQTAAVAKAAGAIVLNEQQLGYGKACLTGMTYLKSLACEPDIVVFLDADYSDHPQEMTLILDPIIKGNVDMVIGSRALGKRIKGSMTIPQVFGNWLATYLMKVIYKVHYTDLGPFRAVNWSQLKSLEMEDLNYGWTIEMQIKAAKVGLKVAEVPVSYRKRIGQSKVSGTVKGVIGAGYKILWTIWRYR